MFGGNQISRDRDRVAISITPPYNNMRHNRAQKQQSYLLTKKTDWRSPSYLGTPITLL